jgi:hypothetical protein
MVTDEGGEIVNKVQARHSVGTNKSVDGIRGDVSQPAMKCK